MGSISLTYLSQNDFFSSTRLIIIFSFAADILCKYLRSIFFLLRDYIVSFGVPAFLPSSLLVNVSPYPEYVLSCDVIPCNYSYFIISF